MSDVMIRKKCGAVEFVKPLEMPAGPSQAIMFSSATDDYIDSRWDEIVDKLQTFYDLEDDWDGNDSVAPSVEVIDIAINIARHLKRCLHPAPDRVIAGVNGTVSFESGPHPMCELEIVSRSSAEEYEDGKLIKVYEIHS